MTTNQYYYNRGRAITSEEAHALKDKSGLVVADRVVNFDIEFVDEINGAHEVDEI